MVCLRNINVDILHKGDTEDVDDDAAAADDDDNNNNIIIIYLTTNGLSPGGSGYNACT